MKKSLKKYVTLCSLVLISILACQKEEQIVQETSSSNQITQKYEGVDSDEIKNALQHYKGRETEGNFIGRVIDDNQQPIAGAIVTLGNQQEITDANGIVVFFGAIVNENFAYAQASAAGYTNGSRVMVPTGNDSFTIQLFSIENSQIIESSGGEVQIDTEFGEPVTVRFNGGFMDENGNPYYGAVNVSVNYLDPLAAETANTMPGELYGIDANFQEVVLGSYGMVNVALVGSGGQNLQITNPAELEIPIHPAQQATAPSQVPMWSFNEDTGVWFEETVAYNTGSHFVAQVNHFSFWNCDAPFPVVNFDATVIDSGTGAPLAGLQVKITYGGFARYAYTNSSGVVSGKIPSNQTMILEIIDECGTVIHTINPFGPYSGATSITIPVTLATAPVSVSGTMVDCSGVPVTNGYVTYKNSAGQLLGTFIVTGGTHSYSGAACALPLTVILDGIDNNTGQAVSTTTVIANPTATANLIACGGTPSEYIRYSINGGTIQYDILYPGGGIQPPNSIGMYASNPTLGTYMYGNVVALGTYPFDHSLSIPALAFEAFGDVNGIDPVATTGTAGAIQFTITNMGPVGTYMDVSFSGNYIDASGVLRTINGDAHIIRDF
ncbi:uncharacterized protein UPF0560 [Kordia periserrulae]|uniref:Uncharacterized protein UPF0560 n=1 Tax=Kordia periserrulae TaxID=701523 RepID=A0A2T6C5C1_9FLAO|nr:hypothetical protein [Kordia periserrulae]PTX63482.1 uncharacterized protein UPF0560 [Kordia periserrulae]